MRREIVTSDCLEAMRAMPEASVTAIVTDPPYGLEFMGKGWDKVLPPTEVWRECLRVLRPGGHALIFGGTRTYHRLACAAEDAGFEVRDCLMWLYGQGFPKSHDVSKALDAKALTGRSNSTALSASEKMRPKIGEVKRVISKGRLAHTQGEHGVPANLERWHNYEQGLIPVTAALTDAARLWSGYGTALKPAWEPILLARKPLIGTVAANALEHGTGALNIGGCRIVAAPGDYDHPGDLTKRPMARNPFAAAEHGDLKVTQAPPNELGRWPANLVLDEDAAALLDEQAPDKGQVAPLKTRNSDKLGRSCYGAFQGSVAADFAPHDAPGGASRFFYCAKASKRDRGEGNSHPTVKPVELMRWLVRLVSGPVKGENLILDPFAGSGTTGVACALEGVPFLLIEREAAYVEIIQRRLADAEATP